MCQINRHFAAYHFCPDLHYLFCACRLYHVRGRAEISVAAMWYNASNYDPKTFTSNVFCSTLRLESRGPQLSSRKQLGTCLVRNIPLLRVDKRPQRRLGLLWQGGASRETIRAGSTPPIRNFPRVSSLRHSIAGSCCFCDRLRAASVRLALDPTCLSPPPVPCRASGRPTPPPSPLPMTPWRRRRLRGRLRHLRLVRRLSRPAPAGMDSTQRKPRQGCCRPHFESPKGFIGVPIIPAKSCGAGTRNSCFGALNTQEVKSAHA